MPSLVASPAGRAWAYMRTVADSGGNEVFLLTSDGRERRLTYAPKDDVPGSWSPDGRSIVFTTRRWRTNGGHDLAVLDPTTGELRQLTRSGAADQEAYWSPDGTRIAFRRIWEDPTQPEFQICWITPDARTEQCFDFPFEVLLGWYDSRQLLALVRDRSGDFNLARVDLDTRELRIVNGGVAGFVRVSPDRRWVACQCAGGGFPTPGWYVYPTDRPDLAVPVAQGAEAAGLFVAWASTAEKNRYLDRLEIEAPVGAIPLDASHKLRARGFDSEGRPVSLPVLSWRLDDATIAAIDSLSGELRPRKVGSVTIYASAGGWRQDSVLVAINPPGFQTLLIEDWEKGLDNAWVPFGHPVPAVTTAPGGRPALWYRADDFRAGVYSRREFTNSGGLGVEAELFTPRSELRAQESVLQLIAWPDSAALANWDHRTGNLPLTHADLCQFGYPAGDGLTNFHRIAVGGGDGRVLEVDPVVSTGQPYTVRLQIFPDGTCGAAFNAKALWRSRFPLPLDVPYRVVLQGKSLRTKILVGHLEVWEGVRGGVDWSALKRPPPGSPD